MGRSPKTHEHCAFGPVIPAISARNFSPIRLKASAYEDAWSIVGPTISRNKDAPIWKLLAIAYLQGVQHGVQLSQETR